LTRLKGLMVYPAIVFVGAFVLSCLLAFLLHTMVASVGGFASEYYMRALPAGARIPVWLVPAFTGVIALVICGALALPQVRGVLRWRIPALREASLAQVASSIALMLKSGVPLDSTLGLMERLEGGTPAGNEIHLWRERLASGVGHFEGMAAHGRIFPPLFVWTVSQSHEDLPAGFQHAAEIYQARAAYRSELFLYSALPCSVLMLGILILAQIQPMIIMFSSLMRAEGMMGGD
jgi:type II secretory pathway component PulF